MNKNHLRKEIEIDKIEMELDKELGISEEDRHTYKYGSPSNLDTKLEVDMSNKYLQKRHKHVVAGVVSDLGNAYGWSRNVVTLVRIATVVGAFMWFWPAIVYFVASFFDFESYE